MKKIAIFCVNYGSYRELDCFLKSVDRAASCAAGSMLAEVFVADNTEVGVKDINVDVSCVPVTLFPFRRNHGYMGAVQRMMQSVDVLAFDYVAVSNVDLEMSETALLELGRLDVEDAVGWIAPSLYSVRLHQDRNPALMERYTRKRLEALRFMFSHPFLHVLYKHTLYKRKKLRKQYAVPVNIYAGHGSFMILTRSFFVRAGSPDYAAFLFCEEIYLAERCRRAGLSVRYCPTVRLRDKEHVSVGGLRSSAYYRYNVDALDYILRTFYSAV